MDWCWSQQHWSVGQHLFKEGIASSQGGGRNFGLYPTLQTGAAMTPKPSIWSTNKLLTFHLLATQNRSAQHVAHPTQPVRAEEEGVPGPKGPQLTQDYWEVWKDETIVLAIVLQKCAMWARAPPDTFCRAVQELHRHLALVVKESKWINMEKETWEGVLKDSMVAAAPGAPMPKRIPSDTWSGETWWCQFYQSLHLHLSQKGWHPLETCPSTKEAATTTPKVFSPGPRGPCHTTLSRCLPARSPNLVWSFHPGISGYDHLPHPSDGQSAYHLEAWSTSTQRYLEPSQMDKEA